MLDTESISKTTLTTIESFNPRSWMELATAANFLKGNFLGTSWDAFNQLRGLSTERLMLDPDAASLFRVCFEVQQQMSEIGWGADAAHTDNKEGSFSTKHDIGLRVADSVRYGMVIKTFVEAARTLTVSNTVTRDQDMLDNTRALFEGAQRIVIQQMRRNAKRIAKVTREQGWSLLSVEAVVQATRKEIPFLSGTNEKLIRASYQACLG